jgi:hypothetical protein
MVTDTQHLPAPAQSHDEYEETIYGIDGVSTWTVDGNKSRSGLGRRYAFREAPFTGSITTEARI